MAFFILLSNIPVERDRQQATLVGSLRGFAAPAAPHLARWASWVSSETGAALFLAHSFQRDTPCDVHL